MLDANIFGAFLFTCAIDCSAADKVYQTGKLLDVDSQPYTKEVPVNGGSMSVLRHENSLAIQVGDIVYIGQCEEKRHFSSCRPGNWIVGDAINVRFEKDNMYLQKAGGGEVKRSLNGHNQQMAST
ncbi:MAG TPA: hypothetical protein VGI45_06615 [Terracidiphilus sp.]